MATESIFLDEILSAPDDAAPRMVYADWLAEHGDPRGEFIHLQCELADTPRNEPREFELRSLQRQLLAEHGERWAEPITRLLPQKEAFDFLDRQVLMEFHRGFIERVVLNDNRFVELADALFSLTPLRHLIATREYQSAGLDQVEQLAICPHLQRLHSLTVRRHDLRIDGTEALMASPHLGSLRELSLRHAGIGLNALRFVLRSESLGQLESLDLRGNELADSAIEELAASELLREVESLELSTNRFSVKGLAALLNCDAKFKRLRVGGNKKTGQPGHLLANWERLAEVHTLSVWSSGLDDASACALIRSPHAVRLKSLDLSSNKALTHKTIEALCEAAPMSNLRELNLAGSGIEEAGAQSLARCETLQNVTRLNLAMNKLGDAGLDAIVQSPVVTQVRQLDLHVNRLTDRGVRAIAQSPHLSNLEYVNLNNNARITDAGILALAQSAHLKGLEVLTLGSNGKISEAALSALIDSPQLPNLRRVKTVDYQTDRAIEEKLAQKFGTAGRAPQFSCALP